MSFVIGLLSSVLLGFLTLLTGIPAAIIGLVKLAAPKTAVFFAPILTALVKVWYRLFVGWIQLFSPKIDASYTGEMRLDRNYLLVSNHKSWVDIFVLLNTTSGRIPLTRFFMKQVLLWIPVVGFVAWTMDFPVMRRYTREYLAKHPEKRGQDLATVRRACERFKEIPVTVVNFSEGTRATAAKLADSNSEFTHVLPPKAGGVATVLAATGEHLDAVVDATIAYRDGTPTFWEWMCGKGGRISVHFDVLDLPKIETLGESGQISGADRERVKAFLLERWKEKDRRLAGLLEG